MKTKSKHLSLSKLLASHQFPKIRDKNGSEKKVEDLQLKILRIQQGIWHLKRRVIIVFEGFDAAGKGGTIRRIVEHLDPRGFKVHPIGPPSSEEQGKHYLYRFWTKLPSPGTIAIFDRSWYGRVLVERVEDLTPEKRWREAYSEIKNFENTLVDDGIDLIKIFLAISKDEQLKRFEERLRDPYKQWKLTRDDVRARKKWDKYVQATDDIFDKTHGDQTPWKLIPANDKHYAREEALRIVVETLKCHGDWMEDKVRKKSVDTLEKSLKKLGLSKKSVC